MCIMDIFEGSWPMDLMDEISDEVGCDLVCAGATRPEHVDPEDEEWYARIKSVEETRAILDSGKFDEAFEYYRKQRGPLSAITGGKRACVMLAIRSMSLGATISWGHKRYLRRHSMRLLGIEGWKQMDDALREYKNGEPWDWTSAEEYTCWWDLPIEKLNEEHGETGSKNRKDVEATAQDSGGKKEGHTEDTDAADEDVPKPKRRRTSN